MTGCRSEGGVIADIPLSGLSNRMVGDTLPEMGSPERRGRGGCGGDRIGEGGSSSVLDV